MGVLKRIKPFVKPFLIIFLIYCVAMIAIWRSGVSYIDDNGRLITGKGWTSDFNRYSSSLLSFLLIQMRFSLVDISPWSQIIAMAFLSAATLIIVRVFGNVKEKPQLVASTLVGLTPFTIGCWLYKFDAPCMALALLATTVPFLFVQSKMKRGDYLKFSAVSVVCLLVTLTSYQAFSGVFLLILLALIFRDFLRGKTKETLIVACCGLGAMVVASLIFKFALPTPEGYRSIEMLGIAELVPGIFNNATSLFVQIWKVFPVNWLVFLVLTLLSFLVSLAIGSKRKGALKIIDVLAGLAFIVLSLPISYGIYLLLADAPTNARSLVGVGVAFAIIAVITFESVKTRKTISKVLCCAPACVLIYLFFIYAFAIGNALSEQRNYSDYINGELAADIVEIYPTHEDLAAKKLQIQGSIGYAPSVVHVAELYPITYDLIDDFQVGLSYLSWGSWALRYNYGLEYDHLGSLEEPWDYNEMDLKKDGYYYRIYGKENKICVVIKEVK